MKAIGILIAKDKSSRFPGKNQYMIKGEPLFWHNLKLLVNCKYISEVFVSTDSKYIKSYCFDKNTEFGWNDNIKIIHQGPNTIDHDPQFWEVLKRAWYNINYRVDIVASILANCYGHKQADFDRAMEKIIMNDEINEVRSYDDIGNETGFLIFRERVLQKQKEISSHLAMIRSCAKEIHYRSDLDGIE